MRTNVERHRDMLKVDARVVGDDALAPQRPEDAVRTGPQIHQEWRVDAGIMWGMGLQSMTEFDDFTGRRQLDRLKPLRSVCRGRTASKACDMDSLVAAGHA
jgi:hypothetical protein